MSDERVIAVVIGRAGSRGLPGKNALPLAGRPMICHTIDDARAARTVDRVVVSTDGDAIADAASTTGVEVVRRPAALASDDATVDAAVRHAVETADTPADLVVILYANVPVRPDGLVDRAVETLRATGADSVQSYARVGKHHPWWMVRLDDDGRVAPFHENAAYRRQDLPALWLPDGGVIAVRRTSLFTVDESQPHAFLGADRRGIETAPDAVIDIDDVTDLHRAEARLAVTAGEATA
jgi:N-acylneuraminate cytidylyltransferase